MAYFGKYALLHSYCNGLLLAQAQNVDVDYDSKAQQVDTIEQGFSGTSEGAEMVTVTVDSAIPLPDFELNPSAFRNKRVDMTFLLAGRAVSLPGIGTKWKVSQATNAASKTSFTVLCRANDFE